MASPDVNRDWWDERAGLHGQDDVYDIEAFVQSGSTLYHLDHEVVGDVHGKDLLHLQCHIGLDTLSWLRAGASTVTGVDFSAVAVEKARTIARDAALDDRAHFVQADVLDLPNELHGRFDVCYASRGVISWIGDLPTWMRQAAQVLRPGGVLALIDMHPLFLMAGSVDPLVLDFPYFDEGPQRGDEQSGTYASTDTATTHNTTVEFGHSLGEIVTAAVDAGLRVERLGEHADVETDAARGLATREPDGVLRWRHTGQRLPIMFSLRAGRP